MNKKHPGFLRGVRGDIRLVQLRACRDMRVNHEQVQSFLAVLLVNSGEQHTAGFETHHCSGREVGDRNKRLAYELFRLIIGVNARQDRAFRACAVVQRELQELLALRYGFAGKHLDCAEIGLTEGLEVYEVLEQRFNLDAGEVNRLGLGNGFTNGFRFGSFFRYAFFMHIIGSFVFADWFHCGESTCGSDVTRHNSLFPVFSGLFPKGQKP